MPTFTIHHGDCVSKMKEMADNSVDSIVTDPPYELGFMGKKWDSTGIAYSVEMWQECLRVLKPGGHLLAFSGSRTYHRMTCAIEDAGFEVRDQIMWVYGSGFPKSLNVSKSLLKNVYVNARDLQGIDSESDKYKGWGTALKPAHEPICVARKPLIGTVADNVLAHGTGALNVDGCRVGSIVETWPKSRSYAPGQIQPGGKGETQQTGEPPAGRWPANLIHDGSEEVLAGFPQSGGGTKRDAMTPTTHDAPAKFGYSDDRHHFSYGDTGSAARFFYCAKASKADRSDGNTHPTVKPTDLMRYLCRLVTPPNGTVLDPFTGSGSTGKAAMLEGFNFVGCEMNEEYVAIAKARIENAIKLGEDQDRTMDLFA